MTEAAPPTEQTLHALYRDHSGWLQNWLRRRLGNAWDAADMSQDTFLRVLSSAQQLVEVRDTGHARSARWAARLQSSQETLC